VHQGGYLETAGTFSRLCRKRVGEINTPVSLCNLLLTSSWDSLLEDLNWKPKVKELFDVISANYLPA
jgi:hypothetical protein